MAKDHSRLAYSEVSLDEKDASSANLLERAMAYFAVLGSAGSSG